MSRRQSGFTLVEIAIVLVIIGLLLGGILKGQELINSARVRNLADQATGVQAAYYGFIDRYRHVPGDMLQDDAQTAIGVTINSGGNGNGRLDTDSTTVTEGGTSESVTNDWQEPAALWEHLSKAGFIQGSYDGKSGTDVPADAAGYREAGSPVNAFNGNLLLARSDDYEDSATASTRLNLVLGRGIPVNVARELDVKIDDGRPQTGVLRLTVTTGATFGDVAGTGDGCLGSTTIEEGGSETKSDTNEYDVGADAQDCNVTFLF
jgi:prepilin-type N-terminal cleavage/methylation domain-containing protein